MKIIFFGTPEIAAQFLREIIKTENVAAVVTQPDKPAGRGRQVLFTKVKSVAVENNIPVFQPAKFDAGVINSLSDLKADVGVVISYGKLIPKQVFTLPALGCFNIHFSLLPKYRGAAPIQTALINGEPETGVSTFWLEETLDTGPVIVEKHAPINPQDDAITLEDKLVTLGFEALFETFSKIASGACAGTAQKGTPSFAPSLTKESGKIAWEKSAREIVNLARGTRKWPGAWTKFVTGSQSGKTIKILKARALDSCPGELIPVKEPGTICGLIKNDSFVVACGSGFLAVEEVVAEGKKPMPAWAYWQGSRLKVGDKFDIMQA